MTLSNRIAMRRTSGLLLTAVLAVACSSQSALSGAPPGTSPSSAVTQKPIESDATSPASTGAPSVTVAPADPLTVSWQADDPTGIAAVSTVVGIARSGDGYVLVAELPYREEGTTFAAWWSGDGRAWELAQESPIDDRILALTAGGPGFVMSGFNNDREIVRTSVDGREWQLVSDASLQHAVITHLVTTASGIVGFGHRSDSDADAIWTSADGIEWLAATNETGLVVARGLQAVAAYDGRAIAFVNEDNNDETEGLAVWETTGRAEWTRTGVLRDAVTVERVAGGARGWVALSPSDAWTSRDGREWGQAVAGPDVASDVIVDDAGFVAVGWVGSLPGETCGDQRPFAGHTWTSADGRAWQRMPVSKEFETAMVTRMMVVDRTLVGFGQRLGGDAEAMAVGRWTATLPDASTSADVSDRASVPKSCGG
jgi:hypothetical protein